MNDGSSETPGLTSLSDDVWHIYVACVCMQEGTPKVCRRNEGIQPVTAKKCSTKKTTNALNLEEKCL